MKTAAPHVTARARAVGIEERWLATGWLATGWLATGWLGAAFVTLVVTLRGETLRVISLRRARNEEAERYRQLHGG